MLLTHFHFFLNLNSTIANYANLHYSNIFCCKKNIKVKLTNMFCSNMFPDQYVLGYLLWDCSLSSIHGTLHGHIDLSFSQCFHVSSQGILEWLCSLNQSKTFVFHSLAALLLLQYLHKDKPLFRPSE